jgi:uncharacterized membrane protein
MLDAVKDALYEFCAVLSISAKLVIAAWATLLIPAGVLLSALLIPDIDRPSPINQVLNGALDQVRTAMPWAALVALLYFGAMMLSVYRSERRRLLHL